MPALILAVSVLLRAEDTLPTAHIQVRGADIEVTFTAGKFDLPQQNVVGWVRTAAEAVAEYFGRFPVPDPRIQVHPAAGRSGIFNGTTYGMRGGFTRISLGQLTTQQEL